MKTNHRRRMQTRTRNINARTPWWSFPERHNESIARRKRLRALNREADALGRAAHAASAALAELASAARRFEPDLVIVDEIRDFAAEFDTLDRLALNGYDVRDEYDQLTAEQNDHERNTR